jgi:dTDP-4-dehydrorhamnose reductase
MKIILFGARGMMGRYAWMILRKSCNVIPLGREDFDIRELNALPVFLDTLNIRKSDVVINCAGILNKRMAERGIRETIIVNSLFPHLVSKYCNEHGAEMIHVSTDYVFSGKRGKYTESDEADAQDGYGITKFIGEPERATIIRTSFIGEETGQKRSLLEWVRSQQGIIQGYADYRWNGVTCLTLAEIFREIVEKKIFWKGMRHIHSPRRVSKFQLLKYINDAYKLGLTVKPCDAGFCDRSLSSNYKDIFKIPNIKKQITEMKNTPVE